eukprot:2984892-Ditylum_brightwellii.AAC.1
MDPSTGVATIGGTDHHPEGIGVAETSWKDDYEQPDDDDGTFATAKRKYSFFLVNKQNCC